MARNERQLHFWLRSEPDSRQRLPRSSQRHRCPILWVGRSEFNGPNLFSCGRLTDQSFHPFKEHPATILHAGEGVSAMSPSRCHFPSRTRRNAHYQHRPSPTRFPWGRTTIFQPQARPSFAGSRAISATADTSSNSNSHRTTFAVPQSRIPSVRTRPSRRVPGTGPPPLRIPHMFDQGHPVWCRGFPTPVDHNAKNRQAKQVSVGSLMPNGNIVDQFRRPPPPCRVHLGKRGLYLPHRQGHFSFHIR